MIPSDYSKRILLCVTGMTPQIVTETLYALVTEQKFAPTEIRIITTIRGRNLIVDSLLNEQQGQFHNFCRDYGLEGKIHFDESCITVITDRYGKELDDIRTLEQNTLAADKIVSTVRDLCQDETSALHVSMAGGRKTMGFYIGYALSLFARPQDRLSHVLVTEPYEDSRNFYYPSQAPRTIVLKNGEKVDASKAEVTLADIPFVRLRSKLPDDFMNSGSYSATVSALQGNLPELHFDIEGTNVLFSSHKAIHLEPVPFALLLWLAKRQKQGKPFFNPNNDTKGELFPEYLDIYEKVVDVFARDELEKDYIKAQAREKQMPSRQNLSNEYVLHLKGYINGHFSHIKTAIGKVMGKTFSTAFLNPGRLNYGITLPAKAIFLPPEIDC